MPIRRSPCELYIKSLICRPKQYPNEGIREEVLARNLDYIGEPYLERLRRTCVPPRPFYPHNRNHGRSQRFLLKEDLRLFFIPTSAMRMANTLLEDPRSKELVESSVVARFDEVWITALLKRNGVHVTPEAIKVYKRYYYNIDLLDSSEVRALIEVRAEADSSEDPYEQCISRSLAVARKSDPRRLAARSAISPLAGVMHQMRFGVMPSSVELAKLASAARTAATVQVLDAALSGYAERSRDFAIVAKTMTEMLETVGNPEEELQSSLHQLALKTDASVVPNIKQLSGGHHTVDLQPVGEKKNERE